MKEDIKGGSRVRCVSNMGGALDTVPGRTYTVTSVYENTYIGTALRLKELPEGSFKAARFELVK